MRGKRASQAERSCCNGITPADAGKTAAWLYAWNQYEDHPRGCGENGFVPKHQRRAVRITPADAGKTSPRKCEHVQTQDHPRGCGENSNAFMKIAISPGSPPRMRGKRTCSFVMPAASRITPADAGKTLKRSFRNQPFCS